MYYCIIILAVAVGIFNTIQLFFLFLIFTFFILQEKLQHSLELLDNVQAGKRPLNVTDAEVNYYLHFILSLQKNRLWSVL